MNDIANILAFEALFVSTPGQLVADAIALVGWDHLGTSFAAEAPRTAPVRVVEVVEWDPAEWASRDR